MIAKKLHLKPGMRVAVANAPAGFSLGKAPGGEVPPVEPHQIRGGRVRHRKSEVVTMPSSQPRTAADTTIQTSEVVDEPTTQLNWTCRVFAMASAIKTTSSATEEKA